MSTGEPQYFHEIAVKVAAEDADPVSNYIIENICGGLLLEDEDGDSHTVITFYVAEGIDLDPLLGGLRRYLIAVNPAYETAVFSRKRIQSLDWIEAYKKSVTPIKIGTAIVVKPPWNDDRFPECTEIIIEPNMAFGTGRHESTQGCLAELEQSDLSGKRILDIGCGSGILGIYAAKKGAAHVAGYDIDPLAVDSSNKNFALNGVDRVCRAFLGTIDRVQDSRPYDVLIVNIIKSVIIPILDSVRTRLAPGGTLILSGLLPQDREEIETALERHGMSTFTIREDCGWLTYRVQIS